MQNDGLRKEIILFGYGKFGRAMYAQLKSDGFSITVASMLEDNRREALRNGITDIRTFNPKRNASIFELGIDPDRHLLYCTMDHTANNLFLVLTLRELYHDATIIAISNSEENTRKLRFAGADTIINIYDSSSEHIINALTRPAVHEALHTVMYTKNDLKIAEIELEEATPLEQVRVGNIDFRSLGVILIAVIDREMGDDLIYLSKGIDHKLDAGDTLVLIGTTDAIERFRSKYRKR